MSPIHIQFAAAEVFTRVRSFFVNAGYNEQSFNQLTAELLLRGALPTYGDPIPPGVSSAEFLFRLFTGSRAPQTDFLRLAGQGSFDDLNALGLIQTTAEHTIFATVRIRPILALYVISDLETLDESPGDFVFAPDDPNTVHYLSFIPMSPCHSFLEACGGSGAAALTAALHGASHAHSSDISERCTIFARFSAALSGIDNFTAVTGDTYQPVDTLTFDRIAMHPPYVPAIRDTHLCRDGGQDGEQITRKHIQNLPGRLNPGGRLYCRAMASDRKGEPYEQRIRQWLGDASADFDIALHVVGYIDRSGFLLTSVRSGRITPTEIDESEQVFNTIRLERLFMAVAVIQRRECDRPAFTVRRDEGPLSGAQELEWLIQFETARAARGIDLILHSRIKANPVMALNILQTSKDGAWSLRKLGVEVVHPYPSKQDVKPFLAHILPMLDGTRTGAELYLSLLQQDVFGPSNPVSQQEFAGQLAELASGGFLSLEGLEHPTPKSTQTPTAK